MAQRTQIIDITKSYLPGDPNAFPQNLINTDREDGEEKVLPALPYEGYNFLPTSYGYKSYFGTNSKLAIEALGSRAQFVLLYQLPTFENRLIALCEDGIWIALADGTDLRWIQLVVHTYDPEVYEEWTWCIIENVLYMYKQGTGQVYTTAIGTLTVPELLGVPAYDLLNDLAITNFTPSFLNMTGQMGIFKAGTRLGFWDSANSIGWSSNLDLTDFTPSIENLAGNSIFEALVGRIVTCRQHGEGFIIYTTKSIVGANFSASGNLLWDAKQVLTSTGIAHSGTVTTGQADSEHFAFTNNGIVKVGKYTSLTGKHELEWIVPEIYDLLKESRTPVYLDILQDRYLCFSLTDNRYINGAVSFSEGRVDPYIFTIDWYIPSDNDPIPNYTLPAVELWDIIRNELGNGGEVFKSGVNERWIPLYTTTIDTILAGFYARWEYMRPFFEAAGRVPYTGFNAILSNVGEPTPATITNLLNPPVSAYHYGTQKDFPEVRAFFSTYGADMWDNNEALILAQEAEWESFTKHQLLNKEKIESTSDIVNTVISPATVTEQQTSFIETYLSPGNYNWEIGYEVYINSVKVYAGTRLITLRWPGGGLISTYTVTNSYLVAPVSNTRSWVLPAHIAFGTLSADRVHGFTAPTGNSLIYKVNSASCYVDAGASGDLVGDNWITGLDITTLSYINPMPSMLGELVTGEGNNEWLTKIGDIGDMPAKEVILRRTFNKVYEITRETIVNYVINNYVVSYNPTSNFTVAEVTKNMGYSQIRMLVTHWDLIEDHLYGNYIIKRRVPAGSMTPRIWENKPVNSNPPNLWSFSEYTAQRITDPAAGTIDGISVYGVDPFLSSDVIDPAYPLERDLSFSLPGSTFLFQTGSISASYPTFTGALVFDLQLKKWGKYKGDFKLLLETNPINTESSAVLSYTDLGTNAGILAPSGDMYLFDSAPVDSWIRYGKAGFYRQGMSNLLEVKASMRNPSTFKIITESSMDGKVIENSISTMTSFADAVLGVSYKDISARWHTIKIDGNFDLTGLEFRATIAGRR